MQTITIRRGFFSVFRAQAWAALALLMPLCAQAHVKWFSEPTEPQAVTLPSMNLMVTGLVLLLSGVFVAKLVDGVACRYSLTPCRLLSESHRPLRLVYYLIAVYFLGAAITGSFLAPHIRVSDTLVHLGTGVQLLIYTFLLLGRGRVGCALLIGAMFVVAGLHDPLFWLEYPLLLGIAWIVLYADEKPTQVGLVLVRCLLGLSLIALAFTEKLIDPTRAMVLLEHHNFNFMSQLGLAYSDRLFVYSAGAIELLLGLVLLLGWVTRLAVSALFAVMVATNVYFFAVGEYQMAMVEMVGHLPIFACGILLLFYHPTRAVNPQAVPVTGSAIPGRLRSAGDTPRR